MHFSPRSVVALLLLQLCSRSAAREPRKDAFGRCLKGTLSCLDPYESSLPREWAVSTPHEAGTGGRNATHAMLDTLMETISFAIERAHGGQPSVVLGDRMWWGMGTIGNKPSQAHGYFEAVRNEAHRRRPAALTLCEIGLNGGHSAVLFLEAAGRTAKLHMFDSGQLPYTSTAVKLVERLYPGQMSLLRGDSRVTTPKFADMHGRVCDVMSIDGNHGSGTVASDLEAARRMSRPGALLLIDDVPTHRDDNGRKGLEKAVNRGMLTGLHCSPDRLMVLPKVHRFAVEGAAKFVGHAWCRGRFAT